MKHMILILITVLAFQNINAQSETHEITVNISNINSIEGTLVVGLYDSKTNFLKKRVAGELHKVTADKATVVFKAVEAGDYAISLFHDENDNKKMDTYLFGIPKEDYGCSNNARGNMGPPRWEDAFFTVNDNVTQNIKL